MASTKRTERAQELKSFLEQLVEYRHCVLLFRAKKTTRLQTENASQLRVSLMEDVGRLRPLITELTGKDTVTIVKNGKEYMRDMWLSGLSLSVDSMTARVLESCIDVTRMAIGRLKSDIEGGVRDKQGNLIDKLQTVGTEPPKAFIAHGGESPALRKLESYLEALGIQPLVVEEQPSEGRSIAENVDYYARQSDFAIILATKGDVDGKTGGFIPRGNVLMEIGKLQELLKDRIVYLVQAGTKLPTNISEKVRVRFSPQSMDDSFIKIAKELKKFGILKAVKPPKEE